MAGAGTLWVAVKPSLEGFGTDLKRQLAQQLGDSIKVQVKPETPSGAPGGQVYGSAFGDAARRRIDAALKNLPNPKVDADTSAADRKVADIRARLDALSGKRIGVDITAAEAIAELDRIKAGLDEVAAKHPDVGVRVDAAAASAELAALRAEVDKLDGRNVNVKAEVDTSSAMSGVFSLSTAIIALGPAAVTAGAVAAGALGGIGAGAGVGIAALTTLTLGFSGVGAAVTAMGAQQSAAATGGAQAAAQQVSSANSIANAQDALKAAVIGVADAQRSAAQQVQAAVRNEQQAEQTLENALRSETTAQNALIDARKAAQRQLEDLATQVQDGALAERGAVLAVAQAQLSLAQSNANPAATALQRQQAQLAYDEAVQHESEQRATNARTAADKAAADAAGVNGAQQVVAAQNQVITSTQALGNAQQGLAQANAAVLEAQRAGAENSAKAQQQLIAAQRGLTQALAQSAAQQVQSLSAVQKAMGNLSPAGQEFARFLAGLKPTLDELKARAQGGLLPGVEQGIKNTLPLFPLLNGLIGDTSKAMGTLATQAGAALNSPFWRTYIGFIRSEAGPTITTFGHIIANTMTGMAGLSMGFTPIWDAMGGGLDSITRKFSDFGKSVASGRNTGFTQFLDYVTSNGPIVVHTLGDIVAAVLHILTALSPLGPVVLIVVDALAKFISFIPTPILAPFVIALWGLFMVTKALTLAQLGATAVTTGWASACKIATAVQTVWVAITKEGAIATGLASVRLWALGAAQSAYGIGAKIATAAQWLWNAALDANPIGIIIVVLAALVAAVIYAYTHFQWFRDIVTACWDGIKIVAQITWDGVLKPIFGALATAVTAVGTVFTWLWHNAIEPAWDGIGSLISTIYHGGIAPVFDLLGAGVHAVGQAFADVAGWIGSAWASIENATKVPAQFVVDVVYNNGIRPVWNAIASLFGLAQLAPVALAGGGVLPGYSPGRDTIPAMLSPGEAVLVPELVAAIGPSNILAANAQASGRPPGSRGSYSGGGIIDTIGAAITGAPGFITDLVSKGPEQAVKALFATVTGDAGHTPGSGHPWTEVLTDIPGKVIDSVITKAKGFLAAMTAGGGAAPAQVNAWIAAALAIMGQPQSYIPGVASLIMHESGGNPNAINLWDSNALAGHPSQGLMQTIPSTYRAYVWPALADRPIVDPIANITAGFRYAMAHYGPSMLMAGGRHTASGAYLGYDSGGWLQPGLTAAVNASGRPEAILTNDQWRTAAAAIRSHTERAGDTYHIDAGHMDINALVSELERRRCFAARVR